MTIAIVGVPIRDFTGPKARLAPVLDRVGRRALARSVAERTLGVVADAVGSGLAVVTGDVEVATWARAVGHRVVVERRPGLDTAAAAVVSAAGGRGWAVIHADLPWLGVGDVSAALDLLPDHGTVLAPSSDGGTSLVAGLGPFPFAYGPGSFHRHLAAAPGAAVVVRKGLALDLDTPADLAALDRAGMHADAPRLSEGPVSKE